MIPPCGCIMYGIMYNFIRHHQVFSNIAENVILCVIQQDRIIFQEWSKIGLLDSLGIFEQSTRTTLLSLLFHKLLAFRRCSYINFLHVYSIQHSSDPSRSYFGMIGVFNDCSIKARATWGPGPPPPKKKKKLKKNYWEKKGNCRPDQTTPDQIMLSKIIVSIVSIIYSIIMGLHRQKRDFKPWVLAETTIEQN